MQTVVDYLRGARVIREPACKRSCLDKSVTWVDGAELKSDARVAVIVLGLSMIWTYDVFKLDARLVRVSALDCHRAKTNARLGRAYNVHDQLILPISYHTMWCLWNEAEPKDFLNRVVCPHGPPTSER